MSNEQKKTITTKLQCYIRCKTMTMLKEYCEANEYDLSRGVDELLSGRLSYLVSEAKKKAEKELKTTNDEYDVVRDVIIPAREGENK